MSNPFLKSSNRFSCLDQEDDFSYKQPSTKKNNYKYDNSNNSFKRQNGKSSTIKNNNNNVVTILDQE